MNSMKEMQTYRHAKVKGCTALIAHSISTRMKQGDTFNSLSAKVFNPSSMGGWRMCGLLVPQSPHVRHPPSAWRDPSLPFE